MSISISSSPLANGQSPLTSTKGAGRPNRPPPKSGGAGGGPPSHESVINAVGASLTEETREAMLSTVAEMTDDGASFDDIKAFVDAELQANGIDKPESGSLLSVSM